uniref:Uncharacterized protein n=1 Tax=Rhizophora mucronata TaxID=61149 RepID=A0A2P2P8T1_RHIMU
MGTVGSKTI